MFLSKEFDNTMKLAFELYNEYASENLYKDLELENITFSEAFENKMQKLLNAQKKSYYYMINTVGKRVAIIVLAVLISLTATTFGVKAIREKVIRFFIETFTSYSDISISGEETPFEIEFKKVVPQYIPEGFTLNRDLSDEYSCFIEYVSSENEKFCYSQRINDGTSISVDTDEVELKTVYINGLEGICYENKGLNRIVFGDEKYFYEIEGRILIEELQKIAESIPLE